RLYEQLEDALGGIYVAPFLRVGSWIGGDRDGNPFVTSEVTWRAFERQAAPALRHYLGGGHAPGRELSLSSRYADIPPDLAKLASRSPDRGAARAEEPFRRALVGVYARLAATGEALELRVPAPAIAAGPAEPYAAPADLLADLDAIQSAL